MSIITLPKISIVTPSYNQGKFLEKTILSVLEQGTRIWSASSPTAAAVSKTFLTQSRRAAEGIKVKSKKDHAGLLTKELKL